MTHTGDVMVTSKLVKIVAPVRLCNRSALISWRSMAITFIVSLIIWQSARLTAASESAAIHRMFRLNSVGLLWKATVSAQLVNYYTMCNFHKLSHFNEVDDTLESICLLDEKLRFVLCLIYQIHHISISPSSRMLGHKAIY